MKKIYSLISGAILIVLVSNCQTDSLVTIADINKIDTSGIYFNYKYLDSTYLGHFSLYVTEENFSYVDDLEIVISISNPSQYKFKSVVKRIWETDEQVISLDKSKESYYNYHDVDVKPLFYNANSESENDSLIYEYFLRKRGVEKECKKIGVYIIIDEQGKASLKNVMNVDSNSYNKINQLIDNMPRFTPAFHKNNKEKIIYLIEIPAN